MLGFRGSGFGVVAEGFELQGLVLARHGGGFCLWIDAFLN